MESAAAAVEERCAPKVDAIGETSPDELTTFRETHGAQLYLMDKALISMGARRVVLEAAHIYGHENPGEDHYLQMRIAAMLTTILKNSGFDIVSLLLIDDLHAGGIVSFDIRTYVLEAASRGWQIHEVHLESSMRELAEVMVTTMERANKVVRNNGNTTLGRKGIHLIRPNAGGELEPSCAALDAAFTQLKLTKYDAQATINVLPETMVYRRQQRNTRAILRAALGQEVLSFLNFYVDLQGNGSAKHRVGRPHQHG